MARPKKDNADYFSHDSGMRNDPKIRALRRKYGITGYAIYNMILEVLTDSDFFEYEWNDLNIELLAGDFDILPEELKDIIEYCSFTLRLFDIENGILTCNTLRKRFESLLSKRKRDRIRVIDSENPQSKVKYSKVKESKEEKSKIEEYEYSIEREILNSVYHLFDKKYFDTDAKKKKVLDCVRLMLNTDGRNKDEIISVIKFAKADDFWSRNLLSILALRKKNDSGVMKYDSIFAKMPKSNTNTETKTLPKWKCNFRSMNPKTFECETKEEAIKMYYNFGGVEPDEIYKLG